MGRTLVETARKTIRMVALIAFSFAVSACSLDGQIRKLNPGSVAEKIQLKLENFTVNESSPPVLILVLTKAPESDVTVRWTVGTVTENPTADFTSLTGTIVIPAGATTKTMNLPVYDDDLFEGTEDFKLTLGQDGGSDLESTSASFSVLDNEATPVVQFNAGASTAAESVGTHTAQVDIAPRSARTTVVAYTVAGTSTSSDHNAASGLLTITAGAASAQLATSITNDVISETTETLNFTLTSVSSGAGSLGAQTTHSVSITDDDTVPTISIANSTATEGSNLVFTVSLSSAAGQNVTFDWTTADNTATTSDADYTASSGDNVTIPAGATSVTLTIATGNDSKDENDETISIALSDLQVATAGTTAATGTISDNDSAPTVSFSVASQNSGGVESGTLTIQVNLSAVSGKTVVAPISVNASSSAVSPGDYSLSATSVTIAAGATSGTLDLVVASDTLDEADETIVLDFGSLVNATAGATPSQTVTINDDDALPAISIASAAATEASPITFTITQSVVSGRAVTFTFNANSGGDGTAGTDYTGITNQVLTIPAGQTSVATTVATLGDSNDEPNETFDVTISGATNATLGTSAATGTINDDDGAPTISIANTAVTEGSNLIFTVTLSAASGQAVTFDWTSADGTGTTADSDYAASSGNDITIAAGVTSVTLTVPTGNDSKDENNETISVALSDLQNVAAGTTSATGTINDNDSAPTIQFSAANQNTGGAESGNAVVTVTVSAASGLEITAPITVNASSTATSPADYSVSASSVTIPAGSTSVTLTITVASDALDEDNETVILDLGTPTNASAGTPAAHTVTLDDDDALPTLSIAAASATEAGTITFTITQNAVSGRDVTFTFNANAGGDAIAGADYTSVTNQVVTITASQTTATASVVTLADLLDEVNETFDAVISGPTNATIATGTVAGTITDDDGAPTLNISATSSTEGSNLVFTVSLTAASGTNVTFDWATSNNTATTADSDYTASSGDDVTITAGQTSVTLTVPTGNDSKDEVDETVTVTLSDVQNSASGTLTADGTINDNDAEPIIQFSVASQNSSGVESGTLTIQVNVSAVSGKQITAPLTVNGSSTAASPADYSLSATTLTIPAGSSNANVTLAIATDSLDEANETVVVDFGTPANATASGVVQHIATIDDDDALPTLSIAASSATEASNIVFTITQSAISGRDVTFTFNANSGGNAVAGTDYTSVTNQVFTISAGASSATATVATSSDGLNEADETFTAAISGPSNATLATASVSGTITDDDSVPNMTISDATATEAGNLVFTVSLSAASGRAVTFDWTTTAGSATSGTDYTAASGNDVSIAAGATSVTLTIVSLTDALDEINEQFTVDLSDPVDVNITDNSGVGTITDDDAQPSLSIAASSGTEAGNIVFTISLSAVSGQEVTFTFNANSGGDASVGTDYTGITNQVLTIAAGSSQVTATVASLADAVDEVDETFTAAILSPVNATLGTASASGTIIDDDGSPTISIAASSATEAGSITFTITQSNVSGQDVTFTFNANSGGNATAGTDYTSVTNLVLTITAGNTAITTSVATSSDTLDEANETFTAAISGPTNATLGTSSASGTITDDDSAPSISIADTAATEGSNLVFTVSLSAASGQDIRFDWAAADGTATGADSDYTSSSGNDVTISAGTTSVTLTVPSTTDSKDEPNETLTVALTDLQNVSAGTTSGTGTITDDDAQPTLQFSAASQNTAGAESGTAVVTITLSAASGYQVSAPITVNASSTATNPSDYTLSATSVTIPAGSTSTTLTVTVVSDLLDETDETVVLDLGTVSNAATGTTVAHTVTIDDDDATPSISIAASSATEAGTITFTITQSAVSALGVTFTFNANSGGNATAGTDYTSVTNRVLTIAAGSTEAATTVVTLTDSLDEVNETFTAAISGPTNATLGTSSVAGTITDDDGAPTLNIADTSVGENGNLVFTVSLTAASGVDVTFDWASSNGTATTADSDYTAGSGNNVTITAGQTSATFTITVADDTKDENDETVNITVSDIQNAVAGTLTATGTITDNDATPTVQFSVASQNTGGAESGTVTIQVNLSAASGLQVTVPVTVNGSSTATDPADYTLSALTVTIAAGSMSGTTLLTVATDSLDEADETVIVDIGTPTNATPTAPASQTVTINDDDAVPSLSIAAASATEASNIVFTITQSAVSGRAVTFTFNANSGGDATADTDYTAVTNQVLTIAAGSTTATVVVSTLTDTRDEPNETFTAAISGPTNASLGTASVSGTINDDDAQPSISVAASSATEAGNIVFTITPSAVSGQDIVFTFNANSGGNATAGTDYTAVTNQVLTIAAGSSNVTTTVTTLTDALDEANETFTAAISGPTNATLGTSSVSGTINDDDATPSIWLAFSSAATEASDIVVTTTISAVSGRNVTFTFNANAGGDATAGVDYTGVTNRLLTITAGASSVSTTIATLGDTLDENDEMFVISISGATNATIGSGAGLGIVEDDDALPSISIGDSAATEAGNVVLTVTLSPVSGRNLTFDWATSDGTAASGTDYTSVATTTATIYAGSTTTTLTIATLSDTLDEPNETINVNLSNPIFVTISDNVGIATINDDDNGPTISIANSTGDEGGNVPFTVSLNTASGQDVTFTYASSSGTATSGTDFTAASGTGTITAGATSVVINVAATDDAVDETDETLTLAISAPVNATLGTSSATGTVRDAILSFDFMTGSLPAGLTFTRASTGTYFDSSGVMQAAAINTPRFDYDPASLQLRGLLMEPPTTNLALYSQDFSQGWTTFLAFVHTDITTAPDGTQTADRVRVDTSNNAHFVRQDVPGLADSAYYTYSVYLKRASSDWVYIAFHDKTNSTRRMYINLASAKIGSVDTALAEARLTPVGSGWYRASFLLNPSTGATTPRILIGLAAGDGTAPFTGNNSQDVYIWGAQLEANYRASSYVASTSTSGNRAGEVLVANSFATWFNATAWTSIFDFSRPQYESTLEDEYVWLYSFHDSAAASQNRFYSVYSTKFSVFGVGAFAGNVGQGSSDGWASAKRSHALYQIASIKSGSSIQIVEDGSSRTSATLGAVPTVNQLTIGGSDTAASNVGLRGHARKFTYRPRALSAAQVQTLTSDDPVQVSLTEIVRTVPERAGAILLTTRLNRVATSAVTAPITFTGTATGGGTDYSVSATTITIPAGSLEASATITLNSESSYEADETIIATIGTPTNATAVSPTVETITIENDDSAPTISVAAASANEGASAVFTISLSASSSQAITVAYATSNGTATQPGDYTSTSGMATIASGATSTTVPVALIDDTTEETDETLTITISSPVNATLGTATATGTIVDKVLDFNFMTGSLPSGLTFTRGSTATYFDSSGVMQTAAINTPRFDYDPATLILQGLLMESGSQNRLTYSSASDNAAWVKTGVSVTANTNETTALDGTNTAEIMREDTANSAHRMMTPAATITGGAQAVFSVYVKPTTTNPMRYFYITVQASGGTDGATAKFDFATGEPAAAVSVFGTSTSTKAWITPAGNGWYRTAVTAKVNAAGTSVQGIVSGMGPAQEFIYTGTSRGLYVWGAQLEQAAIPSSFIPTTTVAVTRGSDQQTANNFATWRTATAETLMAQFSRPYYEPTSYSAWPRVFEMANVGGGAPANNRMTALYSTNPGQYGFSVYSGGVDRGGAVNVNSVIERERYEMAVSRSNLSFTSSIGGVSLTSTLTALPTVDTLYVGSSLGGVTNYLDGHLRKFSYFGRALSSSQINTFTSDEPSEVHFTETNRLIFESAGTVTIRAHLNSVKASNVTIPYTVGGTSTGADHNLASGTLTITAGNLEGNATFAVTDDASDENDETITVAMGTPTGAAAVSPSTQTLTILDDDAVPALSISDNSATEGSNIVLTVSVTPASGKAVTFDWATSNGTATTAGSDYTAVPTTSVTIPAGTGSVALTIVSLSDTLDEADETVNVTLSNAGNATISDNVGIATINDDDNGPTISVAAGTGNEGGNVALTVSLNAASGQDVTFTYASSSGTATSGTDFTAASGTGTITAGATTTVINVAATDDALDETDETFTMDISAPVNATLGTASVSGTIRDATLSFDFTTGTLPSGLTLTRASTATYFNSSGVMQTAATNIPRYDYEPASGQLRGLLIEAGRTNEIAHSTQLENAAWTKTNVAVAANSTGTTAPDGTSSAEFISENSASAVHGIGRSISFDFNQFWTYSVYAKMPAVGGRPYAQLRIENGAKYVNGIYNIANGTAVAAQTASTGADAVATIQPVGNGWYRLMLSGRFTDATSSAWANLYLRDSLGSTSYLGDGSSGAWFWGAQLEIGSQPSSYIPTNATAASRSQDILLVNSFPTWFNASNWTSILDFSRPAYEHVNQANGYPYLFAFQKIGSEYQERIPVLYGAPSQVFSTSSEVGSVTQGYSAGSVGAKAKNAIYQVATVKSGSTLRYFEEGSAGTVTSSISFPTVDSLSLGGSNLGWDQLGGHLRKFTYRPRALSAANTQTITSDEPVLVSFKEISKLVPESAVTVQLTAALNRLSSSQVTVPFTLSGTATGGGTDYSISATTITIPAGSIEASVTLTLTADSSYESDETIYATVGTPTNATVAEPSTETIILLNDDTIPTVSVAAASATEGASAVFTISISASSSLETTVAYVTSNGTATQPGDYTTATGTATIAAGSTSTTIPVSLTDDLVDETDETFTITISSPTNATLGTATATGTIKDKILDFNFMTGSLPSGLTFTRTTTATYFDSSGVMQTAAINTPRFEYDPATGRALGLLLESASTNLIVRSKEFESAGWTRQNTTVPGVNTAETTAPDGTNTADLVREDTTNDYHRVYANSVTITAGTYVTWSAYVKAAATNPTRYVRVQVHGSGATDGFYTNLDLATGELGNLGSLGAGSNIKGWITPLKNGWYRVALSGVINAAGTSAQGVLGSLGPARENVHTGTSRGFYAWGAQLESLGAPTSFIPTTTAAVTRDYDLLQANSFATWRTSSAETLIAQFSRAFIEHTGNSMYPRIFDLENQGGGSPNSNRYSVFYDTAQTEFAVNSYSGGTFQGDAWVSGGGIAHQTHEMATARSGLNAVLSVDGNSNTATLTSMPTVDALVLGGRASIGAHHLNGHMRKFAYYSRNLSATQVNTFTSDEPVEVFFTETSRTIFESAGTVTIRARLNYTKTSNVMIPYTVGGTSTGADHTLGSGTVTITAGTLEGSTTFTVTDDTSDEADETITVVMGSPTGAAAVSPTTQTLTILDDDAAPTISIADSAASEGNNIVLPVTLSAASSFAVTFSWATSNNTSAAAFDYIGVSATTVTIPAGSTSVSLTITTLQDASDEPNEMINVNLSSAVNATFADSLGIATINDDDNPPTISVSTATTVNGELSRWDMSPEVGFAYMLTEDFGTPADASATPNGSILRLFENGVELGPAHSAHATIRSTGLGAFSYWDSGSDKALRFSASDNTNPMTNGRKYTYQYTSPSSANEGSNVRFAVTIDNASDSNVTFNYTTSSGTATSGTDFTAKTGTGTIRAGATVAIIEVPATADSIDEGDENLTLAISAPTNAILGTSSATGTITDATLNFDFTTGTLPTGLTFTRASTATYFNSSGIMQTAATNSPRYDYDPASGQMKGLLIERGSTNVALQSQSFDNATWVKGATTVVANSTATNAPDGTQTAEFIKEDSTTAPHYVDQQISGINSNFFTFTTYAKSPAVNGRPSVVISVQNPGGPNMVNTYFNLARGEVVSNVIQGTGADIVSSIQPINNGWYRLRVSGRFTSGVTNVNVFIGMLTSDGGADTYAGNNSSGIWLWGAQMEINRSIPSSYIPTTTAAVTQNPDSLTVDNFSTWYNSADWTSIVDFERPFYENTGQTLYATPVTFYKAATGTADRFYLVYASLNRAMAADVFAGNSYIGGSGANTAAKTEGNIYQLGYIKAGSTVQYIESGAATAATGTLSPIPTVDSLALGSGPNTGELGGYLRKFTYRPRAASAASVQTMTSDDAVQVSFREISKLVPESVGTVKLTAKLNRLSGSQVTVPYTLSGTATGSGTDYSVSATTITIPAGSLEASVNVTITAEATVENDETIIATIGTPTNATALAPTAETITVLNDDSPSVSVAASSANEGSSAVFTISLSNTSASQITVAYATSNGTASQPGDYTSTSGTATITIGGSSTTVSVPLVDDSTDETDETFTITLSSPVNASLGTSTATGTIKDKILDYNFMTASLPSGLTFTRASTATYFDSNGVMQTAAIDAPRFDYDPATKRPLGLLIEGVRTNSALRSAEFDNAYWLKTSAVLTANTAETTTPDGTNTAEILRDNSSGGRHQVYTSPITVPGGSYVALSFFVKPASTSPARYVNLWIEDTSGNSGVTGNVDLWAGVALTPSVWGTGANVKIWSVPMANGWYRVTISGLPHPTATSIDAGISLANAAQATSYVGSGSGIYIWGAQVEVGPIPSSYIPTTSATVQRNGDTLTPTGFATWRNASAETAAIEFTRPYIETTSGFSSWPRLFEFANAGGGSPTNNRQSTMYISNPGNSFTLDSYNGGVQSSATGITGGTKGNQIYKERTSRSGTSVVLGLNGATVSSSLSGAVSSADTLVIAGQVSTETYRLMGHVRKFAYYSRALSSAQLTSFTADDPTEAFFTSENRSINEGSGTITIEARLTASKATNVTVPYTVGGTTTGADHNLAAGTLTITAGNLEGTKTFTITDDSIDETDETITVIMGTPTGATATSPSTQTITVIDNDSPPALSVADASATEGSSVVFTISLAGTSTSNIVFDYATSNSSATAGTDYTSISGTATIAALASSLTLTVTTTTDTALESDETFLLTISNPLNATILDNAGIGTITNDDPPTISGVSPSSGASSGGTTITLTGTGFLSGASATVGGTTCTSPTVVSATQFTCVTPAGTAGAVNVVLTNSLASQPNGTRTVTAASAFTYVDSTWNFGTVGHFTYSSSLITTNSGANKASLTPPDLVTNTQTEFDAGTHYNTQFASSVLSLNSSTAAQAEHAVGWTPQHAGIIGYWKFNGTVGSAIANNAAVAATIGTGAVAKNANGTGMAYDYGKISAGVKLAGVDDYLQVAHSATYNTLPISVSLWVRTSSTNTYSSLIDKYTDASNNGWNMWLVDGGLCASYWSSGVDKVAPGCNTGTAFKTSKANDGQWHMLTYVVDTLGSRLYKDGHLEISNSWVGTAAAASSTTPIHIGRYSGSYYPLIGNVDEVAIWNVALTSDEVMKVYSKQVAKFGGVYQSPVLNLSASESWKALNWTTDLPFYKELPGDTNADGTPDSESSGQYPGIASNLQNGLVALWHFNESTWNGTTNEVKDSSGKGTHGVSINGAKTGQGLFQNAGVFDGVDDQVVILRPGNGSLDFGSSTSFSYGGWFFANRSVGEFDMPFYFGGSSVGSPGFDIELGANGWYASIADTGSHQEACYFGDATGLTGKWVHLFVALDRSTNVYRCYLNGVEVGSVSTVGWGSMVSIQDVIFGGESYPFDGYVDEVAIWNRYLTPSEVLQLYRRGANRVSFQVRSCNDNACAGETWQGPTNTAAQNFSELNSWSTISSTGLGSGTISLLSPALDFAKFASAGLNVVNNQYFQYRAVLESDDTSTLCTGAACLPSLTTVTSVAEPNPPIVAAVGRAYSGGLKGFGLTVAGTCTASTVKVQVSTDNGATYKYWNGTTWVASDGSITQASTLTDAQANITSGALASSGTFRFRAYLTAKTTETCELTNPYIQY